VHESRGRVFPRAAGGTPAARGRAAAAGARGADETDRTARARLRAHADGLGGGSRPGLRRDLLLPERPGDARDRARSSIVSGTG
jgi:hypothetical protein